MRKLQIYAVLMALSLGLACLMTPPAAAQNEPSAATEKPVSGYRLDFVISEVEGGKKINSRSYSMLATEAVLTKVRVRSNLRPDASGLSYDLGMDLDCRVRENAGYLLLDATIDSSGLRVSKSEDAVPGTPAGTSVEHVRSEISALVTPGKPTMISSLDDPASKRQFQIEVTATKIK